MSEEEKILKTIRYCANDYMKQEDGIQCFEWGDLWVLNEYIENIKQERDLYKSVIDEIDKFIKEEKDRYIYQDSDGAYWYYEDLYVYSELKEILDKAKGSDK